MKSSDYPIPEEHQIIMQQTPQNPIYHGEGDVWTHTLMVLEHVLEMNNRFELSENDKQVLYWSALLHDIGKPSVTVFKDGRWRATRHERAGVPIARDLLLQNPEIDLHTRRKILDIVRWHYFPFWWMRNGKPEGIIKEFALRLDLKLLAIFGLCDFLGRISIDLKEALRLVENFLEVEMPKVHYEFGNFNDLNKKFHSWNRSKKNAGWGAIKMKKMDLVRKLSAQEGAGPSEPIYKKIFLTMGPQASGKSHYLKKEYASSLIVDLHEFGLKDLDDIGKFEQERKLTEFKYYLQGYFRRNESIVLEGRNINEDFRMKLNEVLRMFPAELHYLVFETPLKKIQSRISDPAQLDAASLQHNQMLDPHPWEAHKIHWIS